MTLSEKIFGSSIGSFIQYGKTAAAAKLLPLLVDDNGDETGTLAVAVKSASGAGMATSAKQDTQITAEQALVAAMGEVQASPTANTLLARIKALETALATVTGGSELQADIVGSLPAGTNLIGRTGVKAFKFSQNFTRPADTTAYTALDAVSNSTSAPTILSQDLASFGAVAGQFILIVGAQVIASVKNTGLNFNIWCFNQTFSGTNDNSEFSVDDTTAQTGGQAINCANLQHTALNSKVISDQGQWLLQLGAASTTLYAALQTPNGFTPSSAARYDVVLVGYLL